jgi:excisionase family DNA binding protein
MATYGERATLTVDEAAKILGISRNSAYQGILTREIPHIKIGRRILVPKAALMRLLESSHQSQEIAGPGSEEKTGT